ncbi:MAG TPA: hypothetical protein VH165_02145 [Kofleriaceae bacterium]|nr:hypothetical protein [Kofleriaceae bacterium]
MSCIHHTLVHTLAACALASCALAACINPDYHCATDLDCNVGTAGRCEIDQRCTAIDATCPTHRRYSEHSGPSSGACFDDHVAPADLCAAGQPPALAAGCVADVCTALPSCCATGWSEACVQQAQISCSDLVCDTRIAITAVKPGHSELWDLRWDGTAWSAVRDTRQTLLAWLAPPPGTTVPKLAGFMSGNLVTDDFMLPVATGNSYVDVTSVDFDRDGRPTAVLSYTDPAGSHLQVTKLDDLSARVIDTVAATRVSWGDVDHDAYPDGIAAQTTSARYSLLSNIEADDHSRAVDDRVVTSINGGTSTTNGIPAIRGFDWLDIDGDHALDVVAYGYSVDVHSGKGDAIGTTELIRLDCDPPASSGSCDTATQQAQSFGGAALPAAAGPALVLGSQPNRALYRAVIGGSPVGVTVSPYTFPIEVCGTACAPIVAVVVRDLDGDHALDVVAIDANLQIYTGLAKDNLTLRAATKLATTPAMPDFITVRTSVTGAAR